MGGVNVFSISLRRVLLEGPAMLGLIGTGQRLLMHFSLEETLEVE
jgi:hypothetical protein